MANGQHRVVYPLEAFDGGLNSKYAPNIVADNQSPDCLNVVFDDLGGVATRGGMTKFNSTTVGSFAGDGLFTARFNDGTEKMVGWWNGTGYAVATNTFVTIASAQSVWTAGSRVDTAMYQNLMFMGNGYSQPYKYNGTEFTRHGITAPNSTPAATSGTAGANGAQTGDVNYLVTYVNSYAVESDIGTVSATLTVASTATVSLTGIPFAPVSFGVGSRRLYRRDAGTANTYKRVATIADNTTTTYLDAIPVASLGAAAPTDQGVPPVWQFTVSHQERLWATVPGDPSTLYYSELANPFVFKVANTIPISNGDGEVITGLAVHANMVAVFKTSSVWLIYMPDTDPTNWIRVKSKSKYGAASHYAQADFEGLRMFIGTRYGKLAGFMSLAGDDTQQNAVDLAATRTVSDAESEVIEPEVFLISTAGVPKACAIEYKNKIWMSVPYNAAVNNRVFQFDYTRRAEDKTSGSWVPFTFPHGFNAFTVYGGKLYGQSATAHGFVYELDTSTYSDDGTAINSYMWTKEFFGRPEHMENWKDFRLANLIVETLGSYYMNITFKADADFGAGTTVQVNLTPGGSVWGVLVWGAGTWGADSTRKNVTVPFGTLSGKRVEMKFSNQNTLNQGFHVFPMGSFTYNTRGRR
jgi:hypothetical protein